MPQHIRVQLLQQLHAGTTNDARVDAVLTLPTALTADAPVWSPEPQHLSPRPGAPRHLEIATAAVWVKPVTGGLVHVIAHHEDDGDVMVGGVVNVDDLLGFGGVHANPGRLAHRAVPGTAGTWRMANGHPLMIYRRWVHRWDQEILWHLRDSSTQFRDWPAHRVQRLPDRSWQVVFSLLVEGCSISSAATTLARTLDRLRRRYGPLTRLRVCAFDESRFDEPLLTWACEAFAPDSVSSALDTAMTG